MGERIVIIFCFLIVLVLVILVLFVVLVLAIGRSILTVTVVILVPVVRRSGIIISPHPASGVRRFHDEVRIGIGCWGRFLTRLVDGPDDGGLGGSVR